MIISPEGAIISEMMDPEAEGIIYADIDTRLCAVAKSALDIAGQYSRGDVFAVTLNTSHREGFLIQNEPPSASRALGHRYSGLHITQAADHL